jgi:hypothetical protein
MNYLKTACATFALSMAGLAWSADVLTADQSEIKQFIEKMYSYDPMTFEAGYFVKKTGMGLVRNEVPSAYSAIKYIPEKKCLLLKLFFDDELFQRKRGNGTIDCDAPNRYPFLSDENQSSVTRYEDIPTPHIKPAVVSGNRAKVIVFPAGNTKISNPPNFDLGRNLYYLTKTENSWRITNVMIHTKWPDLDDGMHHCYYSFAKAPNDEEAKEIPKHCRR